MRTVTTPRRFRGREPGYQRRCRGQLRGPVSATPFGDGQAWRPLADVTETDDGYVVEVEVPGVRQTSETGEGCPARQPVRVGYHRPTSLLPRPRGMRVVDESDEPGSGVVRAEYPRTGPLKPLLRPKGLRPRAAAEHPRTGLSHRNVPSQFSGKMSARIGNYLDRVLVIVFDRRYTKTTAPAGGLVLGVRGVSGGGHDVDAHRSVP